jgi:transcriptional regulator with XRE-family HTH domain
MNTETVDFEPKRHLGRNVRKIREYMGMKQEAVAIDLGMNQQDISKIEQQEEIEDDLLEKIANSLGVTPEMIRNFDLDRAIYNINNHFQDNTFEQGSTGIIQHFNAVEKIVELYERLLNSEKEKIDILTQIKK